MLSGHVGRKAWTVPFARYSCRFSHSSHVGFNTLWPLHQAMLHVLGIIACAQRRPSKSLRAWGHKMMNLNGILQALLQTRLCAKHAISFRALTKICDVDVTRVLYYFP